MYVVLPFLGCRISDGWRRTHSQLSRLSSKEVEIITNPELIAFHQDTTVGKPAAPFISSIATDTPQFYSGESIKGTHVFVVNTNDTSATFNIHFADVPGLNLTSVRVHDMWSSMDLDTFWGDYDVTLAAHDTAALLVTPV